MYSLTEENYLKSIYLLANHEGETNLNELSTQLKISMPTVNSMVKKLNEKKLLIYEKYKPVKLTQLGAKEAALIVRKHRLTEMFLVEKMNFGWEEVHDIAEQVEHVKSPSFFSKMDELLGFPTVDPHGSPIPDNNGEMRTEKYNALNDFSVNEVVMIKAINNSSEDFLKFLNQRNLKLGTIIKINHIEAFDKSFQVSYNDVKNAYLSLAVCERLLVKKIN